MWSYFTSALKGPAQALAAHRQTQRSRHGVLSGVAALEAACPATEADDEAPIFLLSAGWRSGSTLLQRLVMSDRDVLIWGEPYDECGLIQAMADSSAAFRPGWPRKDYFYDGTPTDKLSGKWVANLFPAPTEWRAAHRALFQTLFAEPAHRAGVARWGLKEVRFSAEHCHYLRWLYPKARFVFLYRNPLDAYRSYCRYGRSWYDTYPDKPVFTPKGFGRHWRKLMEGYLRDAEKLDALLLRYEDLIGDPAQVERLESYLGIAIDHGILNKKVRNSQQISAEKTEEEAHVSWLEKWLLRREVEPLAARLGYSF